MSRIRSHIEYLIQTYYIILLQTDEKFSCNDGFSYDLMMILDSGLFFGGPPCRMNYE